MPRLSNISLSNLPAHVSGPAHVRGPAYDRKKITPGIVHLGIGAFHRAHQAVYIDSLLAIAPTWGIIGVSMRKPDTAEALNPQDGLYAVQVRDGSGTHVRVVGSILEILTSATDLDRILVHMTAPTTRIVSLTVTEKGYAHDPATGELDQRHADVVADLAAPGVSLRSVPALITEALARRRANGTAPFTVLCCDNLPSNGKTVRRIVTRFAALRDASLAGWIENNVTFPCTMVDRIVPATTDQDREELTRATGLDDAWPISTEPFSQWVVEDAFCNGRPDLASVGVELVDHVEAYELMKLRTLNGSHSTLSYLGFLSGYQTVSDTMADPAFTKLIHGLMTEEIIPTLNVPGKDLFAYRDQLLARFNNPALKHRTWQIAMDGSQKLPQRLLGTIRDRIAAGEPYARLALGVAAWMRYVMAVDEHGQPIDVRDPLSARLKAIADAAGRDPKALVAGFTSLSEIFGTDLPVHAGFLSTVEAALAGILAHGARASVAAL